MESGDNSIIVEREVRDALIQSQLYYDSIQRKKEDRINKESILKR